MRKTYLNSLTCFPAYWLYHIHDLLLFLQCLSDVKAVFLQNLSKKSIKKLLKILTSGQQKCNTTLARPLASLDSFWYHNWMNNRIITKCNLKITELHTFYSKCAVLWSDWNTYEKSCLVYFGHITTNKTAIAESTTFASMVIVVEGLNCQNLPSLMPVKA